MILEELDARLASLAAQDLLRRRRTLETPCGVECIVDGRAMLSFASNDYLGLANEPARIDAARETAAHWGVGAGASHLVSGHLALHELLEQRLAAFAGSARSLYFS